jgi:hypothetical protein
MGSPIVRSWCNFGDAFRMAFMADSGLARFKNAGIFHDNEDSRLKPGVSPMYVHVDVCNLKALSKVFGTRAAVMTIVFILNFSHL